jgi:Zn-dependent protease
MQETPTDDQGQAAPRPASGEPVAPGTPPPGYGPMAGYPSPSGYPPMPSYPPVPVYPPPPEHYRQPVPPSAPPPAAFPPGYPGAPAYPPAAWPPGQWGASPYPSYAPDGRVDPELMRQTEPGQRRAAGKGAGAAVGLGATLLAALTKLGILAKFALPLFSALASFAVYAALYGWEFGLGIVVLLFVHEMGHVAVIRAKGLPASSPVFIPLMGALIFLRGMPRNVRDEAEIALGGPLAGALAGGVCYVIYTQTGDPIWLVLAFFSFLINLFNLIPFSPLDGGRIVGAVSKWIWPVGLIVVVAAFFYTHSFILLIVGALGVMRMVQQLGRGGALAAYYTVPLGARLTIAALYFGLAAALAVGILAIQPMLVAGALPFGR